MAMMTSDTAGPVLGNEDGRMQPGPGNHAEPDGDEMVPCPACQGSGQMPMSAADQLSQVLGPPEEQPGMENTEGLPPDMAAAGPTSPVTDRTSGDMQSIADYKQNRPAHLQHQPLDENAVAASGKRVRERMRQSGARGGF